MAAGDSEFLSHASEVAFDLGRDRFRLRALDIAARRIEFAQTEEPLPPPVYEQGEPPATDRRGRRRYDWQPAADAPAWMNLAWLLDDLAAWIGVMAEDHITVQGLDAPEPGHCDVLLLDGDTRLRARVALTARTEPLDHPGMFLRDLFAEGRSRGYLVRDAGEDGWVVDLRGVL
ncbi:hypothetical protein [Streptomyces sp. NPDC058739]|uniref:hypothetical protein n=1 Tax=Streptomyces sp. NPDC058739 TaxID=3346618 RepID=UPI0036B68806